MNFLKYKILDSGQLSFNIGTFFLASALPISGIFFLNAMILSFVNEKNSLFGDFWNKFLIILSGLFFLSQLKFYFSDLNENLFGFDKTLSLINLFNFFPLFLVFISFQKYLENEKKRKIFLNYFIAGLIPVLFSCFIQYTYEIYGPFKTLWGSIVWFNKPIDSLSGVSGLFSNSNYTGFWLSISLPLILPLLGGIKKFNFSKFIILLIFLISTYFLLLTNSRNALLGLLSSSVIVFGIKNFFLFLIGIGFLYFLVSSIGIFIFNTDLNIFKYLISEELLKKILEKNISQIFEFTRIKIWKNSLKILIQNPIFGLGASTFPFIYRYYSSFPAQHAHNFPLQIAIEYGLVNSILLSFFAIWIFFKGWKKIMLSKSKKNNFLNKCWIAAVFITFISHMTDITYYDGKISLIIWILLAGLKSIINEEE